MPSEAETERILARDQRREAWDLWGPYLSERQWGTVREDYSADGDAWSFFPHDHARSRVYRWGEDGLLGICDSDCRLCFAPAFWNGHDPILKERFFGLSNPQGNHGEDLKEYFYHLDNTPTHSYMRALYKYPQQEFPYQLLIEESARRTRLQPEFELVDTGIFAEGRYFDIFIEYAKAAPTDICIKISAINRGPESAPLTILPTLWFRNTWSWGREGSSKPQMHLTSDKSIRAAPWGLPVYHLYCEGASEFVFTDNETNNERLFAAKNASAHVKDAFHDYVVEGKIAAINPACSGTKGCPVYRRPIAPDETSTIRLRLTELPQAEPFGASYETTFRERIKEADDFFEALTPDLSEETALIQRRSLAGLFWSKKFYYYPVLEWLEGDPTMPPPPRERWHGRNAFWKELHAHDIISMPDCWEYPYFCAWDLMFHSVAFAVPDPATAKRQNMILHGERFASPSAQLPAYEWALSDANPPIASWAMWRIYSIERSMKGEGDREYLKRSLETYYKTMMNSIDFKNSAVLLLNHHVETDVVNAEGKAYGVEVLLKKASGKLNGWISYTYSRSMLRTKSSHSAETVNGGKFYPSSYDKPHAVNVIGNYKFSRRFNFSMNMTYSTGRPITLPLAKYDLGGNPRLYYSERNQFRIPDYFRVDVSINVEGNHKIKKLAHSSWTFAIYNLTGRENAYSVYFTSKDNKISGYKLSIFGKPIPTITYNFKF